MAKQKIAAKQKIKRPGKAAVAEPVGAPGPLKPGAKKARVGLRAGKGILKQAGKPKALRKADTPDDAITAPLARVATHIHKIVRPKRLGRLGRMERLEIAVGEVRRGGRLSPRTRKLQVAGVPKMAQKLIEEAGEVAIEALQGNRQTIINESVDLLYNLLVLLEACSVPVEAVWAEMDRRELTLGMAEKLPKAFDPDG